MKVPIREETGQEVAGSLEVEDDRDTGLIGKGRADGLYGFLQPGPGIDEKSIRVLHNQVIHHDVPPRGSGFSTQGPGSEKSRHDSSNDGEFDENA